MKINKDLSGSKGGKMTRANDVHSHTKTGTDVADAVKDAIKSEYPMLSDAHAMRLAVLLTKAEMDGEI